MTSLLVRRLAPRAVALAGDRRARLSAGVALGLGAASVALSGCLPVEWKTASSETKIVGRSVALEPHGPVDARGYQDGTRVIVEAERTCQLYEQRTVETTTVRKKRLKTPAFDVVFGVLGSALVGGGAALAYDAQFIYPSQRDSRLYNVNGPDGQYVLAGVLIAVGAIPLTVALVDLGRSVGREEKTSTSTQRQLTQPRVACRQPNPAPGVSVYAYGGPWGTVSLGATRGDGTLDVDVAPLLPDAALASAGQVQALTVQANGVPIGKLDLTTVWPKVRARVAERDEAAWANSNAAACKAQRTPEACAGVTQYLQAFPSGAHAAEAKLLVSVIVQKKAPVVAGGDPVLDAARAAADEAATKACKASCAATCKKDAPCKKACEEICQ